MKVRTISFGKQADNRGGLWIRLGLALFLSHQALISAHAGGAVLGWGNNNAGQSRVPAGLGSATAIAAGSTHSLAVKSDGTVVAWGWNQFGQTNVPASLNGVVAVSGGDLFSMALKSDGTVVTWGKPPVAPAYATNDVKAIAAGWDHCVALKNDGTVVSWGSQTVTPAGLSNVLAVAAGNSNSLALKADGTVVAWGDNSYNKSSVPSSLKNVAAIAAGKDHCLALKTDGTVVAWGRNDTNQATVPTGLSNVVAIAAGGFHSLALRGDGSYMAWGDNSYNQSVVNPSVTGLNAIAGGGFHSLVIQGNGTPVITVQPVSLTLAIGQTASFRPMAVGAQPLGYQWLKNGTNLPGATSQILSLTDIQFDSAGTFALRVTNSLGSVMSASAVLTVVTSPPWINTQPQNLNMQCGQTTVFTVVADGPPPLSYQWQFQGVDIADATKSSLTLPAVTSAEVGGYNVIITNVYGVITSVVAQLNVVGIPTINTQPQRATVYCGDNVALKVVATGPIPLTYQWLLSGLPMLDATNATLRFNPVLMNDTGDYSVIVTCPCGAITSAVAQLTVVLDPPQITSSLNVTATQGQLFTYQITALHSPTSFSARYLPPNLNLDPATGLITGTNVESGDFGVLLSAANACSSDSRWLTISVRPSAPGITSPAFITGIEGQPLTYQITASNAPTSFGVINLPTGLSVDPTSGIISGQPTYAGEFDATIAAYNPWGVGTGPLHFSISNAVINGLSIANITTNYYSPYLLEFQFTLRDNDDPNQGNALTLDPSLLVVKCYEGLNLVNPDPDKVQISPSETAQTIQRGNTKVMKTYLVLDFTASVADIGLNGDVNTNNVSDAIDLEVQGAQDFVTQQPANAQIGVFEFHRDDLAPQQVQSLTTDKVLLHQKIAGIWTNYVQDWPAGSRIWDATLAAIQALGASTPDEQHYTVLVSDGKDESSLALLKDVIKAATNNSVHVYCVGFGTPEDLAIGEPNLTNLCYQTKGRYYSATNSSQLAAELAQIGKDIKGQYILRWATLKRGTTSFLPSFEISYQGKTATTPDDPTVLLIGTNYTGTNSLDTNVPPVEVTTNDPAFFETNWVIIKEKEIYQTNWAISPYAPDTYAGPTTNGTLFLSANADIHPTGIDLIARYVPRYIRRFNLHYRANWPCTVNLQNTNVGQILYGWTMTQTDDGAGGTWLLLNSSNPASLSSSIPFAAFGRMLTFTFKDSIFTNKSIFSFITNDNTIYTNTGKQSFVITNVVQYSNSYPVLPMGTPAPWLEYYKLTGNYTNAELSDVDKDGAPAWQEYRAGTNPTNVLDKFYIRSLVQSSYDFRYRITFSSKVNRTYRVEASTDLVTWQTVQDNIPGINADISVSDKTLRLGVDGVFYRVLVY